MDPARRRTSVLPAFKETVTADFQKDEVGEAARAVTGAQRRLTRSRSGMVSLLDKSVERIADGDGDGPRETLGAPKSGGKQPANVNPFTRFQNRSGTSGRRPGVMDSMKPGEGASRHEQIEDVKSMDTDKIRMVLKDLRKFVKGAQGKRKDNLKARIALYDGELQHRLEAAKALDTPERAKRDHDRDYDFAFLEPPPSPEEDRPVSVIAPPTKSNFNGGSKRARNIVETSQNGRNAFSNKRLESVYHKNLETSRIQPPPLKSARDGKELYKPKIPLSDMEFFGPSASTWQGEGSRRSGALHSQRAVKLKVPDAVACVRKLPRPRAAAAAARVAEEPVEILDDTTDEDEAPKTLPLQEGLPGLPAASVQGCRRSARLATSGSSSGCAALWLQLKGLKALYPAQSPADCVPVCAEDLSRLAPEEFLNDSVIDFYLRVLRHEEMGNSETVVAKLPKERCHFFNSYFYKKLTEKTKSGSDTMEDRHNRVKRWTKGVDIFQKDYLFVPIHDALHWSLAIICYPGGIEGKRQKPTQILHLDSLRGCHNTFTISQMLRNYLRMEWGAKKESSGNSIPAGATTPRHFGNKEITTEKLLLPQQGNHTDCGLFLLTFLQYFIYSAAFLTDKDHDFSESGLKEIRQRSFPGSYSFLTKQWFRPANASRLRCYLQYRILKLFKDQADGALLADDSRWDLLDAQIKEYEGRRPTDTFQVPEVDFSMRPPPREAIEDDAVWEVPDQPEEAAVRRSKRKTRKQTGDRPSRRRVLQSSDESASDEDKIEHSSGSGGAGDARLLPQSERSQSAAKSMAAAALAAADAAAGDSEDDFEMSDLSQGMDSVNLRAAGRPRGGGGWGTFGAPPRILGSRIAGAHRSLDDGAVVAVAGAQPAEEVGSDGGLQYLKDYGDSGDEQCAQGSPRGGAKEWRERSRESTPQCCNGPTEQEPHAQDALQDTGSHPHPSDTDRVSAEQPDAVVPSSQASEDILAQRPAAVNFRWIQEDTKHAMDGGEVSHTWNSSMTSTEPASEGDGVVVVEATAGEHVSETEIASASAAVPLGTQLSAAPGPGRFHALSQSQVMQRLNAFAEADSDGAPADWAEGTQAGSSCPPQQPQHESQETLPKATDFAPHPHHGHQRRYRTHQTSFDDYTFPRSSGASRGLAGNPGAGPSPASATSSGNLQASTEENSADTAPQRDRLTKAQRYNPLV